MPNTELEFDKLLRFIDKHSDQRLKPFFTDGELQRLIEEEKPDLGGNEVPNLFYEILRMLKKLIKDGLIEVELQKAVTQSGTQFTKKEVHYYITYEGRCFEGYVKQKERRQFQDEQEKMKATKLASDAKRLADGTRYLWIATGFLVLVELFKWAWKFNHQCR